MIRNFFISNLRVLWKNGSHTLINMLGLSLGITCSILIFLIVRFELSYDNYHSDRERIYRVVVEFTREEPFGYTAGQTYPIAEALRTDFEDLENVVLVDANVGDPVITIPHADGTLEKFKEKPAFVDDDYFQLFQYDWISGNADALKREKTVVISESFAKKYFGSEPPMNKVINYNNEFDVTVTGVIKDPPRNTDFPFHLIFSNNLGANKRGWDDWGAMSSAINCYLKLKPGIREENFQAKLKGWHVKYFTGNNAEDGKFRNYFLQPLKEMHFDTRFSNFGSAPVSGKTLLTLGCIGLLLLLTACINFINLNTVLIINRAKEVGIRKVMGSSRSQLVFQFLAETFIITFISLLISTGIVELALIYLVPMLGYNLDFRPLTDPTTFVFLAALPVLVTLLSGLYPGMRLSGFQPVKALKNKLAGNPGQGLTLRRSLIVFQLMITQVLVVSTIIVVQQINHFMSQPLGLNSNSVMEFGLPENKPEILNQLRDRLLTVNGIETVAMSNTGSISENQWNGGFEATVNGKLIKDGAGVKFGNADYLKTYQLTLVEGENLIPSDSSNQFLANESFVRALGLQDPAEAIGIPVNIWGNKGLIRGVVRDFNANSLHEVRGPVLILTGPGAYYVGAVRLNNQDMNETITSIEKIWEDVYPKYVFEYSFLDDTIYKFYDAERRNSYVIGIFAGIAIFIGCIGLFGLISFMAKSKTKEVGIRKTLGASVTHVITMFSKEFLVLVLISFVLSTPVIYYFMEEWLSHFAYRIHPGAVTFLLGIGVSFIIVMGTVGIKSYRAATANPIDALRDE